MSPLINAWDEMFDYNHPFTLLYSLCNTGLRHKLVKVGAGNFSTMSVDMGRSSLRYDGYDYVKECVKRGVTDGVVI
jgi:hypothetical protein